MPDGDPGPKGRVYEDTDMGDTVKDGAPGVQRQGPEGWPVLSCWPGGG